jgi:hypothetical protein
MKITEMRLTSCATLKLLKRINKEYKFLEPTHSKTLDDRTITEIEKFKSILGL